MQSYCKLCMKSRAVPKDSDDGSNPTVPRKRRQLAVPNGQLQEDIEAMQRAHAGAELALPIQMTGLAFMVRMPHFGMSVALRCLRGGLKLFVCARSYAASRRVKAMVMVMMATVWSTWSHN